MILLLSSVSCPNEEFGCLSGLFLYANCELLAVSGFGRGCDVCTRAECHQEDKNTHLMFGRPNKGPHFKLTHFSSGDISIYENFFNDEGVNQLCGTNNGEFFECRIK